MQPWPTAYTFLHRDGQAALRLIVLKAQVTAGVGGPPGTVHADAALKRLFVEATGGAVEIIELQPAGKRRMAASEFLRGNVLSPGARVGPEVG
jgi:methionyl-tRNA formyltransferase